MKVTEANKILRRTIGSDRWYFEERGNGKIVLLEKLRNRFSIIFPLTTLDGLFCNEVYDFHVRLALNFVKRRRNPKDSAIFDKKAKVNSAIKFND